MKVSTISVSRYDIKNSTITLKGKLNSRNEAEIQTVV